MDISQIVALFSGVALFLFGMTLMGDGLKQVSGNKLETILFRLSGTQFKGILLGTGVTAVIQSSCATSVMTVGFVNSGIMKLRQAISVILGSILGTSITGWVICLSYIDGASGLRGLLSTSTLTGFVAVAGIVLRMFGKKQIMIYIGNIMMGFAILMFGMSTMSGAVSSLGDAPWFRNMLTQMSHPAVGILVGALLTALLQSASAAVGILQALSVSGAMTLESALPLLLGVTIGASAPVLLSALGASINGRRSALVYLILSVMGVAACASVFYIANAIVGFSFMSMPMNPVGIAMVNSLYRLAMTVFLAPFTDVIEAIVVLLVPERKEEAAPDIHLEERFLAHPAVAIEQCRLTINEMAVLARRSIDSALGLLWEYSEARFAQVEKMEEKADRYEDVLGTYLTQLTGKPLTTQMSREVSKYLHVLSDFERLTDHALNIAQSARERSEKHVEFSEAGQRELRVITGAVSEVTGLTADAFTAEDNESARKVEPLEQVIDDLCDEMKLHHVERIQQGKCTIRQGFIFNDILTNMERISDHCSNVAVAMIELNIGSFDTHEYLDRLKEKKSGDFAMEVERFHARYSLAEESEGETGTDAERGAAAGRAY